MELFSKDFRTLFMENFHSSLDPSLTLCFLCILE